MKKITLLCFIAVCTLTVQRAAAQTDSENLENAKTALRNSHNCDDAMKYLNQVSPDSRLGADYLLCMANVQDCKKNTEQALYYYNKYLTMKPGTDSVVRRVAELKDQSNHRTKVNNEQSSANETYHAAAKTRGKKRKRLNLVDNYYNIGIGYGKGIGGDNAPYKSSLSIIGGYGFVVFQNKAVVELNTSADFLLNPNKTWFANVAGVQPSDVGSTSVGTNTTITLGLAPILVNKKNLSLTAGVEAGIAFCEFSSTVAGADLTSGLFSPVLGIKSNLYLGENCMFYLQAHFLTQNQVTVSDYAGDYSAKANLNTISIGVSFKFDSWF